MERRSLYHSLRVNWQLDPTLQVKPWQVEDYRKTASESLFSRLNSLGVVLDYNRFIALSDAEDTPEDFAETLLPDTVDDQEIADQIYLIIFELWRRFLSERQTLSTFCDEWDHQIDLYEAGDPASLEVLGDLIGRFTRILEETEDQKEDPKVVYQSVLEACAHDIEGFLYDFASSRIEEQNFSYAKDIVDAFLPVATDKHWFSLLQAEILYQDDKEESEKLIHVLLKESSKIDDLPFLLEFLAYLAKKSEENQFFQLSKIIVPQLCSEEDLWDFLASCEDFFHYRDDESNETAINAIKKARLKNNPQGKLSKNDSDLREIKKILFH